MILFYMFCELLRGEPALAGKLCCSLSTESRPVGFDNMDIGLELVRSEWQREPGFVCK